MAVHRDKERAGLGRWLIGGVCPLALALAGCGGGGSAQGSPVVTLPTPAPTPAPPPTPTPTVAQATEREIVPATVNPALPASDAANFTINANPLIPGRGRLFVMLPGTAAIPRNYRTIVRSAVANGYHGIGLTYANAIAVGDLCAGVADPDCTGNARREIITGENVSNVVAVDTANSIVARLTGLITQLHAAHPNEGWGQFLRGGTVDWSLLTVAGHSQGSGHAAYMAKLYTLDRTVMFSGPGDLAPSGTAVARWFSLPNVTPTNRQYGFTHSEDELVPYALVRATWNAIGLPAPDGTPFLADGATVAFGGGNQFVTNAPPSALGFAVSATPRHASPVADGITPTNAQGEPLYAAVWRYMGFP